MTRATPSFIIAIAVTALAVVLGVTLASAATIEYSYTVTLDVTFGPDGAGLDGATVQIQFEVPDGATYGTIAGHPAILVDNESVTISGAGVADL